jgi:hypothetical protein
LASLHYPAYAKRYQSIMLNNYFDFFKLFC